MEGGSRQPLAVSRLQIDDEAYDCNRFKRQLPDAETAHFDEATQCIGGPDQQARVHRFEVDAIVGDQASEPQRRGLRRLDQCQREARLAGA